MEASATPERESPETAGGERAVEQPDGMRGLRRLRDRVEAAVSEIERLRRENAALAARVADLQASGASVPGAGDGASFPVDGDLRERLDGYIAAIDEALRVADARH